MEKDDNERLDFPVLLPLMPDVSPVQRELIRRVLGAALDAVGPRQVVRRALAPLAATSAGSRRFRLVGAGKAAVAMACGAVDALGERIGEGVLITKHNSTAGCLPERIQVRSGGHPLPDDRSVAATRELVAFLSRSSAEEPVLCLISGGGSALMTLPVSGVELVDLQELTRLLLASGATINEINTLRKHLDVVKGGGLARLAAPAQISTLILSDVIGSPLDVIASGPTGADSTTYGDALAVLQKYRLVERVPAAILSVLRRGCAGALPETLKPGDAALARVTNTVIASNRQAANAALAAAGTAGFHTLLLTTHLQGEAAQAGMLLATLLQEIDASGQPLPRPACIVAGGETTVTVRGSGRGGRNQELALGSVQLLSGLPRVALVTLATDGEDGPTDAAGAVVTGATAASAQAAGISVEAALRENDSYAFFRALDAHITTGPTGTNVNDLTFLFAF